MMRFCAAACGLLILILSCSKSSKSSGRPTGAETTNSIAIQIQTAEGRPVSGARVMLQEQDSWFASWKIMDTLVSDGLGRVWIDTTEVFFRSSFVVTVDNGIEAGVTAVNPGTSTLQVSLAKGFRFEGVLDSQVEKDGLRAYVLGTSWSAPVDTLGRFVFQALPEGFWTILFQRAETKQWLFGADMFGNPGNVITRSQLIPIADKVVLDDFNRVSRRIPFGAWTGEGWWYIWRNEGVTMIQPLPDSSGFIPFEEGIIGEGAWIGNSPELRFTMDSAENHLHIGVRLATDPLDLSELDTIRFWMAGDVEGSVRFEDSQGAILIANLPTGQAGVWKHLAIPVDTMRLQSEDTTQTRGAFLKQVREFRFELTKGTRFQFDDLWFEGVGLSSFGISK